MDGPSARWPPRTKKNIALPFAPVVPGVEFVRFNDVADLESKFDSTVCAIGFEFVQGEGGIRPVSQEFAEAAHKLARKHNALLIADEIQSGMGRTGKWFAYQHYGIQPDLVTVAKPIAGGLPLGALLATEKVSGMHSSGHARHNVRRRTAGLRRGTAAGHHSGKGEDAPAHPENRQLPDGTAAKTAEEAFQHC